MATSEFRLGKKTLEFSSVSPYHFPDMIAQKHYIQHKRLAMHP